LQVPFRHRAALTQLGKLSELDVARLLELVSSSAEPLVPKAVIESLRLPGVTDVDILIDSLFTLEQLRAAHDWPRSQLADAVASADELALEGDERKRLAETLERLLSAAPFLRAAKAADLMRSHPESVHTVRILSDVRPVFDDEISEAPVGAVIMQQLEIEVLTPSGPETIYLAADDRILLRMKQQIERALEKSRALSGFLVQSEIPIHVDTRPE
jgi:hypothetical protein